MNGFIQLHRRMLEWEWYDVPAVKDAFIHLLLIASYKDKIWKGIQIKRGQAVISYQSLAEKLGYSVQQTRTAISKLKSTNEITTESTSRYTLVTLVNYEKYQAYDEAETNEPTNEATNDQQTINMPENDQITSNQQHLNKDNKLIINNTSSYSCYSAYTKYINAMPSPIVFETLTSYLEDGMEDGCITAIIEHCNDRHIRDWNYIKKVINNSFEAGIRTKEAFYRSQQEHEEKSKSRISPPAKGTKFSNFPQRGIDYNEIAKRQLQNRLKEEDGGDENDTDPVYDPD